MGESDNMSPLEGIAQEELSAAVDNIKNTNYLENLFRPAPLSDMMSSYGPRLVDYLISGKSNNIGQVLTAYFSDLYPEFKEKSWRPSSVSVFVGQIVKLCSTLFPKAEDVIHAWKNTTGDGLIDSYDRWDKAERL